MASDVVCDIAARGGPGSFTTGVGDAQSITTCGDRPKFGALADPDPTRSARPLRMPVAAVAGDEPAELQQRLSIYLSTGACRAVRALAPRQLRRPLRPPPEFRPGGCRQPAPITAKPICPASVRATALLPMGIDWELEELLGGTAV